MRKILPYQERQPGLMGSPHPHTSTLSGLYLQPLSVTAEGVSPQLKLFSSPEPGFCRSLSTETS